jgi:hypothetical protein
MKIHLLGRVWKLLWVKKLGRNTVGDCDPPDKPNKVIRVLKGQEHQEELRALIHECLHACGWWADEEWVDLTSTDIAKVLWRLGWRKGEEN